MLTGPKEFNTMIIEKVAKACQAATIEPPTRLGHRRTTRGVTAAAMRDLWIAVERRPIGLAVAGILSLGLAGVASATVTNMYWARGSANRNFSTPRTGATSIISALNDQRTVEYNLVYQSDGNLVLTV